MIQVATVKSGEVWSSGRSGSIYFDLDLGEAGDVTIRLDPDVADGGWHIDTRELHDGTLRDVLHRLALARGTRGGIAKLTSAEMKNHKET